MTNIYTCANCARTFKTYKAQMIHEKQWCNDKGDARKQYFAELHTGNTFSKGRPKGSKNVNPYPMTEAVHRRLKENPPPSWEGKCHTEETKQKMSKANIERMAKYGPPTFNTLKGRFIPQHPEKYAGDPTNIIYRSSWELRLFKHLDTNTNVLEWASEEIIIPYLSPLDNRVHRYFPDVLMRVRKPDGSTETLLVEVKPLEQTMEPQHKRKTKRHIQQVLTWGVNQAKWKSAQEYCDKKGWKFKLITEVDLGINTSFAYNKKRLNG